MRSRSLIKYTLVAVVLLALLYVGVQETYRSFSQPTACARIENRR
jgi:hypothetical protein